MQSVNQTSLNGVEILIISCGDIGQRLAHRAIPLQANVLGLRRNTAVLPENIKKLQGDISKSESLAVLENLQPDYMVVTNSAGKSGEDAYRQIYLDGLGNVLSRVKPKRRLLLVSSTSVYGQRNNEWVDENSATEPAAYSGRIQLQAEALARSQVDTTTVVRFAGIYGPGRKRLIDQVKSGQHSPASPEHYSNRIHVEDCAAILLHLILRDFNGEPLAPCYLGVDDTPVTMYDIKNWMAGQLGLQDHWQSCVSPTARGGSKRCSNALIKAHQYEFIYPSYKQGYGELLRPDSSDKS